MTTSAEGGDDEEAKNASMASFYGEDIFDDLIAKALDSSDVQRNGTNVPEKTSKRVIDVAPPTKKVRYDKGRRTSDVPEEGRDSSSNGGSIDADDVASLDSEEISGGSDVSEVEAQQEKSYIPPPLVNDDESTIDLRPPAPQSQTVSSYVDQLNRSERSRGRLIKAGAFAIVIAIIVGIILAVVSLTGNTDGGDTSSTQKSAPGVSTNQTSFTSTSTPTMNPVAAVSTPVETIHPVQLTFQNIPAGYRLPADDRKSIISFVEELLKGHIDNSFELLEVAYAGVGGSRRLISRRLESLSLPLRIVIRGPSNFSEEFVRSYIVEEIQDQSQNIENYLKVFDGEAFQSVTVSADTYEFTDLIEPTDSPSIPPQTRIPTASPSMPPQTGTPTISPSLPPQTKLPTASPSQTLETFTKPSIIKLPTTRAPITPSPTTPAPITNEPTKNPSRRPTRYPTPRPTPRPTRRPSYRPTPRPTPQPTPRPTRRPTNRPTNRPILVFPPNVSPTVPANGSSNDYFCAETSVTANWNTLLNFNCALPCPSKAHTDCPGGHQCRESNTCDDVNGSNRR